MNIILNIEDINCNNFFVNDEIKNTIIDQGTFHKLNYSNEVFTLTNSMIELKITEYDIYKNYHRYKIVFSPEKYKSIVEKISSIEKNIINILKIKLDRKKRPVLNIGPILSSGYFKISHIPGIMERIALKISGIWETDIEYGLTYKFVIIYNNTNRLLKNK